MACQNNDLCGARRNEPCECGEPCEHCKSIPCQCFAPGDYRPQEGREPSCDS